MSRQHADELLAQYNKASEEAVKAMRETQLGTAAASFAARRFDLASARHRGAISMLEAMTLPAETAPQRDHARAFSRGYVIARERPLVAGDYPPEGHADHGSQSFVLALCMGAAYATASVPFWEAVHRWAGQPHGAEYQTMTPEFMARRGSEESALSFHEVVLAYHEIQDQDLALVVTDDLDADLYAGACEGREALEHKEGDWETLSTEAQDTVLGTLAVVGHGVAPLGQEIYAAAARALRHLAGRTEPENKPEAWDDSAWPGHYM